MHKQSFFKLISTFLIITMLMTLTGSFSFAADGLIPPGQPPASPKPGGTPEPYITPAPVSPAEVVPLGIGATFTLFSSDHSGVSAASATAIGAVIGDWGSVASPQGGTLKGPFTLSNVSPVTSEFFGTADIVTREGAAVTKSSMGAVYNRLTAYMEGGSGGMVVYKPKAGWLKGVDTKLSCFYVHSGNKNGIEAIIDHAGGRSTVPLVPQGQGKAHHEVDILDIGTFTGVTSVSINTLGGGGYYLPPVTFKVVNDHNSANPNPYIPERKYEKPGTATIPGKESTPNPTPNPNISVRINEICSDNKTGSVDGFGVNSDWIELYNNSGNDIDISGWGISDSPTKAPFKSKFPAGAIIPAGGYLIVRPSDEGKSTAVLKNNEYHVDFKIDKGGEAIRLANTSGVTVDYIDTPEIETDKTFSRYPNGADTFRYTAPTIRAANVDGTVYIEKPEFSHQSGFYANPITVTMTGTGTIRYTTDGSDPTLQSPPYAPVYVIDKASSANIYSAIKYFPAPNASSPVLTPPKLPVDKATIVRAAAFDAHGNRSNITTKTYFIGHTMSQNFNNIPVISLVSDPANFFDNGNGDTDPKKNTGIGIFTHSTNALYDGGDATIPDPLGNEWERPVHVSMFESDGSLAFHQNAGMSVRGLGSSVEPQKGLTIKARTKYGHGKFDYPIFGEQYKAYGETLVESYDNFALKQGGRFINTPKYIDPVVLQLTRDLNIGSVAARSCAVFIDGEYWGTYFLEERTTDNFIEDNYGVPKDDVMLFKGGKPKGTMTAAEKTAMDNVKNTLKNIQDTDEGYKTLDTLIDIEKTMLYYASNINSCNIDWEPSGYNFALWRSRTVTDQPYQDGKWRPVMNDLDCAYYNNPNENSQVDGIFSSTSSWATGLMRTKTTKARFANACFDVFNSNLESHSVFDEMLYWQDELKPMYAQNIDRWNFSTGINTEINGLYWRIVPRKAYMANVFKKGFNMKGTLTHLNVRVNDVAGGTVKVNSIEPDFGNGSWDGFYFTDYTTKLIAQPAPGYYFIGWQTSDGTVLSGNDATTYVTLNPNGSRVTAVFHYDPNYVPPTSSPAPSSTPAPEEPTPSPSPDVTPKNTPMPEIVNGIFDNFAHMAPAGNGYGPVVDSSIDYSKLYSAENLWLKAMYEDDNYINTPFQPQAISNNDNYKTKNYLVGIGDGKATSSITYKAPGSTNFGGNAAQITVGFLWSVYENDIWKPLNPGTATDWTRWDLLRDAYYKDNVKIYAGSTESNMTEVQIDSFNGGSISGEVLVSITSKNLPAGTKYVKFVLTNAYWGNCMINSVYISPDIAQLEQIGTDRVYDDFTGWTISSGTNIGSSDKAVAWESDGRLYSTVLTTWFGKYSRSLGGRSSAKGPLGVSYRGDFEGKMAYIGLLYHGSLGDKYSAISDGTVNGYDAWDYHYAHLLDRLQIFAGPNADNLTQVDITHITGGLAPVGEGRNPSVGIIIDKLPDNAKYVKILINNTNWVDKFLFVDINNADKEEVMASAVPVRGGTVISNVNKKSTDESQINAVTLLGEPANGLVVLAKYKNETLTGIKTVNISASDFIGPIATAKNTIPSNGLLTLEEGETYKAMFFEGLGNIRPISPSL